MEEKQNVFGPVIRTSFMIMILCGICYPLVATVIAQLVMPEKADGSLIYDEDNKVIGSELIGQNFTSPELFHGRVSSIEYNAEGSGSNNYAPSNPDLVVRVDQSLEAWKQANPETPISELPMDLVTNSGSGLDPHISPDAAYAQVNRIAAETGLTEDDLNTLVADNTDNREWGLFGEERVNVLLLNIELLQKSK